MADDDRFRPLTDDELGQYSPAGGSAGGSAKVDDWDLIVPIPDTVPDPDMRHSILGEPAASWLYRDETGGKICFIGRYNKTGGDKEFRPRTWCKNRETGREEWRWRNVPPLRPLYGVELLAQRPDTAVIVTEGEKACEAARSIFTADVVVSPMNGAKSPHKADWEPLRGRHIIIWPDHDKVGQGFAVVVAGLLKGIAASICVVDVQKLIAIDGGRRGITHNPDGWDAADAMLEWDNLLALHANVMKLAKPHEDESGEAEEAAASSTPRWGDDELEILAKLSRGDTADFLTRAKSDLGFPFEPEATVALNKFAKGRPADWQRLRAQLKTLKIVSALDAMMKAEAAGDDNNGDDRLPGRPIRFEEIEPWDEPLEGAQLLTQLADVVGKYVIMEPCQRDAAALGAVFAHTHDLRDTAPIFFIVSPTKRCGKTRLERVIKRLVPKPLMASSATPAFLARLIEKHRPTVLIDEFDATVRGDQAMAETLRGQLNSSFDRDGAQVGKCVPLPGGGYEEREFSTWAPTWIAGIKKIPETVEDRSVVLRLKRKLPGEKVARFRGKDGGELSVLRRKIARFVADNEQRLRDIEPDMPESLNAAGDRAPDAWEPLVAIADVAGGVWPQRARNAAVALTGVDMAALSDSDVDVELLFDISQILDACDTFAPTAEQLKNNKLVAVEALEAVSRVDGQDGGNRRPRRVVGLGGEQLTNALATFIERKWPTWDRGKPMRPNQLARLLRAFGATSQPLRDGSVVFRGYPRDRLDDAIGRYLIRTPPSPGDFTRHTVTDPEEAGENEFFENVTDNVRNAFKNAGNPSNSWARDGVTPKSGEDKGGAGYETDGVRESTPKWRGKI